MHNAPEYAGDEIRSFLLLPGANLELVHAKEFLALESIGLPCNTVFLVRATMQLPDLGAKHDQKANIAAQHYQKLIRSDEGANLSSGLGVELYLCPETDKGTEKFFKYLLKVSNACSADTVPIPSDLGLEYVAATKKTGAAADLGGRSQEAASDSSSVSESEQKDVVHEGVVRKRGQVNAAYQERYFVLTSEGTVKYYKDLTAYLSKEPWQGSLVCQGANVESNTGYNERHGCC